MNTLTIYALRFADGTWFRKHWSDNHTPDVNSARLYTKLPQARGQATKLGGEAEIVPFIAEPGQPLDEKERVEKALRHIAEKDAVERKREAHRRIKQLNAEVAKAEDELEALRKS